MTMTPNEFSFFIMGILFLLIILFMIFVYFSSRVNELKHAKKIQLICMSLFILISLIALPSKIITYPNSVKIHDDTLIQYYPQGTEVYQNKIGTIKPIKIIKHKSEYNHAVVVRSLFGTTIHEYIAD